METAGSAVAHPQEDEILNHENAGTFLAACRSRASDWRTVAGAVGLTLALSGCGSTPDKNVTVYSANAFATAEEVAASAPEAPAAPAAPAETTAPAPEPPAAPAAPAETTAPVPPAPRDTFVTKKGLRDVRVQYDQGKMIEVGCMAPGQADGVAGSYTVTVIRAIEKGLGITPDNGEYEPDTRARVAKEIVAGRKLCNRPIPVAANTVNKAPGCEDRTLQGPVNVNNPCSDGSRPTQPKDRGVPGCDAAIAGPVAVNTKCSDGTNATR